MVPGHRYRQAPPPWPAAAGRFRRPGALPDVRGGDGDKGRPLPRRLREDDPMTDEQGASEGSPGFIQPWIAQLRKITEELAGMTGLGESVLARPVPSLPSMPLPGAISASQLNALASALAAQRSSIAA